jgi:hypothetical protein
MADRKRTLDYAIPKPRVNRFVPLLIPSLKIMVVATGLELIMLSLIYVILYILHLCVR